MKQPDLYTKLPDRLKAIYPKDLFRKIPPAFRDMVFDFLTISPTDYPHDLPAFVAVRDTMLRALQAASVIDADGRLVPQVNPLDRRTSELPVASGGPNDYDFDHLQENCPIAVDLGCHSVEEGRATWGNRYLVLPDGQHGPAKFGTHEEKAKFLKLSGQREKHAY